MDPASLLPHIARHGIEYAVVVDLTEKTIERVGAVPELPLWSLDLSLFEDTSYAEWLNDPECPRLMPCSWSQKPWLCLICKPIHGIIVGFFYQSEREMMDEVRWSEAVDTALKELWTVGDLPRETQATDPSS